MTNEQLREINFLLPELIIIHYLLIIEVSWKEDLLLR